MTGEADAVEELAALPSLGKISARLLVEAGITDAAQLRSLGPIEGFRRLRFHHGKRVSVNFVYAMECAILGIHWQMLSAPRKAQLRQQARAVEASLDALGDAPPRRRPATA